jgi:hypothetical protein
LGQRVSARASVISRIPCRRPLRGRDIADLSDPLDAELPDWFVTPDARHAHARHGRRLKGVEPSW